MTKLKGNHASRGGVPEQKKQKSYTLQLCCRDKGIRKRNALLSASLLQVLKLRALQYFIISNSGTDQK